MGEQFLSSLRPYQRRLRIAALAWALVGASAVTGVVLALFPRVVPGAAAFVVAAVAFGVWWGRGWTTTRAAHAIEVRGATADNVLVTAEEIATGRLSAPHPVVSGELFTAALGRLGGATPAQVQPLARPLLLALAAVAAVATFGGMLPAAPTVVADVTAKDDAEATPLSAGDLRVVVHPPAYTQRARHQLLNPTTLQVLEGSRLRLETSAADRQTVLIEADGTSTPFVSEGAGASLELVATTSRPLIVRYDGRSSVPVDRLLHLRVEVDARPTVRIVQPAKDLVFPQPKGEVPVVIEARDDVALTSVTLRYTKVSGSGETFTFEEGEWPARVEHAGRGEWVARATLALETLKLQDGDTLVYRAIAHDAKPGGDPSSSDTFLIEVGRLAGVASTGFALPDDRERQAISQQMVIIKTERLLADRPKHTADAFAEQARMLAVEQRMVKAEFVFMTGGEVADEVEEAEHAHELAEGRLENAAQVELLNAIREMSRAEARLNAADVAQALTFERSALRALQRAFDRRRYLLRTLPERARIDVSRRLTGELAAARSSVQPRGPATADPFIERARTVLAELAAATRGQNTSTLASQIIALDPSSAELQKAALQLAGARETQSIAQARTAARAAIVQAMQSRMPSAAPTRVRRDPLRGRLTQEIGRPAPR